MRARVPLMIQDPELSKLAIGRLVETWTELDEDHYLDGPITPRVAVIDLHPTTEQLEPGAIYEPPEGSRRFGRYRIDPDEIGSPHFIQASVFGTVMRTMYLFEEPDVLGRKIRWAFDGPQLLVVPRAGWWENAFYERRSRSLQFFSFRSRGRLVHTSLSRDIVAHETAHAILDGIAPDLYDALDPQSLALHEGIADLTAVLIAFRSSALTEAVLNETKGSIENSTAFSAIGEEFGRAIDPSGQVGWLRNLLEDKSLDPDRDPGDEPEAHTLSQYLTGALYRFLVRLHQHHRDHYAEARQQTKLAVSGLALWVAAQQFKRTILRGLDYLPPGEVTFADYARAILAADQASFPDDTWRAAMREELVRHGIVRDERELEVETNVEHPAIAAVDLGGLAESDWVAYTFAEANRKLLGIPSDAQFEILPRITVNKRFEIPGREPPAGTAEEEPVKELLFKVRWSVTEPNPPELGAATRRIQTGTTLVIDWHRKRIRSLLSPGDLEGRRPARDTALRRMVEDGLIVVATAEEPREVSRNLETGIDAVVTAGILRVKGTGRLLHVARDAGHG